MRPLDEALLGSAVAHPLAVTVEDGYADGGAGSAIEGTVRARSPLAHVLRLGVTTSFVEAGEPDELLKSHRLDAHGTARRVVEALAAECDVGGVEPPGFTFRTSH